MTKVGLMLNRKDGSLTSVVSRSRSLQEDKIQMARMAKKVVITTITTIKMPTKRRKMTKILVGPFISFIQSTKIKSFQVDLTHLTQI